MSQIHRQIQKNRHLYENIQNNSQPAILVVADQGSIPFSLNMILDRDTVDYRFFCKMLNAVLASDIGISSYQKSMKQQQQSIHYLMSDGEKVVVNSTQLLVHALKDYFESAHETQGVVETTEHGGTMTNPPMVFVMQYEGSQQENNENNNLLQSEVSMSELDTPSTSCNKLEQEKKLLQVVQKDRHLKNIHKRVEEEIQKEKQDEWNFLCKKLKYVMGRYETVFTGISMLALASFCLAVVAQPDAPHRQCWRTPADEARCDDHGAGH